MNVFTRHNKSYTIAIILCLSLGGIMTIITNTSVSAKSLPEIVQDQSNTRKNPRETTASKAPVASVAPTPSPQAQQAKPTPTTSKPQSTKVSAPKTISSVSSPAPAVSSATDTSSQVRQVAAAQAVKTNQPSSYPTQKISSYQRDNLYKASVLIALAGALLYLLSYAPSWHWMYKNNTVSPSKILTE